MNGIRSDPLPAYGLGRGRGVHRQAGRRLWISAPRPRRGGGGLSGRPSMRRRRLHKEARRGRPHRGGGSRGSPAGLRARAGQGLGGRRVRIRARPQRRQGLEGHPAGRLRVPAAGAGQAGGVGQARRQGLREAAVPQLRVFAEGARPPARARGDGAVQAPPGASAACR